MPHTLTELVAGMVPTVVEESRGFWEATLAERLCVQRCRACDHRQLPPGACCARCWSQDLEWQPASGRGRVFSFTVVRHAFHPSFAETVPYVVADIELDEGPVITSNVTGCAPEDVSIGMRVRVWFDEEAEDAFHQKVRVPRFEPEA